jgi:hypothetical protein
VNALLGSQELQKSLSTMLPTVLLSKRLSFKQHDLLLVTCLASLPAVALQVLAVALVVTNLITAPATGTG